MIFKVVLSRDSLLSKLCELRRNLLHLVRGVTLSLRASCRSVPCTVALGCRLSIRLLGLSVRSSNERSICQEIISTVIIVLRELLLLLVQLLSLALVLIGIVLLARKVVPRE